MTALSPEQTEQLVNSIVALLKQRERAVFAVCQSDLAKGLSPSVYVQHAHLHIQQPDLGFMKQLACADTQHAAVCTVLEAWSFGIQVHVSIHRQLLNALPVRALSSLPLTLSDHTGLAVYLCAHKVIGYADVISLQPGLLLIDSRSLVTALASDVLKQRHIHWIRSE